jgi:hypothetical protein
MDLNKIWIGAAIKYGGKFIIGAEALNGGIIQLSNSRMIWGIESDTSFVLGPSVGGGAQLIGLLYLNVDDPQHSNAPRLDDYSIEFSLGGRWTPIVQAVRTVNENYGQRFFHVAFDLAKKKIKPPQIENIRNYGHRIMSLQQLSEVDNSPVALAFEIPGAGYGLGLGISYSWVGKLNRFGPPIRI